MSEYLNCGCHMRCTCGEEARVRAELSVKRQWYPEMPPRWPSETISAYTDRLTGADKKDQRPYDHRRFRQCSIGYHDECTDQSGDECECPCHRAALAAARKEQGE